MEENLLHNVDINGSFQGSENTKSVISRCLSSHENIGIYKYYIQFLPIDHPKSYKQDLYDGWKRGMKPSWGALCAILLHLQLFSLHTFESGHDVLVVSHLRGCRPCQWYFRLWGLLSLGCQHPQVDGRRGCHGNRPLGWDTVQALGLTLKSFHW